MSIKWTNPSRTDGIQVLVDGLILKDEITKICKMDGSSHKDESFISQTN